MAPPNGNKYAEKYTRDEVLDKIELVKEKLIKGSVSSIHKAYISEGIYSTLVAYWKNDRFKNDEDVLYAIKEVSEIGHELLRGNMLEGTVNATAAIWIDKTVYKTKESDDPKSQNIIINYTDPKSEDE